MVVVVGGVSAVPAAPVDLPKPEVDGAPHGFRVEVMGQPSANEDGDARAAADAVERASETGRHRCVRTGTNLTDERQDEHIELPAILVDH